MSVYVCVWGGGRVWLWFCDIHAVLYVLSSFTIILLRIRKQSELPRPILRNYAESDHGCTSRIFFDNVGVNVTLTLYNVTLTLYSMTLISQKPC